MTSVLLTGLSDRYAAVLKSHVRRYSNEGHDVSTAAQFLLACASYDGVKNVHAFECQLPPSSSKNKFKIHDIAKLHNFIFETTSTIRSYRTWNIGSGKLITSDRNVNLLSTINSLVCVNSSIAQSGLVDSSTINRSDKPVSSVNKNPINIDEKNSKSKLFYCNQEGCVSRFLNYGNLLRHVANGSHTERIEKSSMKDLAMITYKSKLDAADNQQLISLELEKVNFSAGNYSHIPPRDQGWVLPLTRKVQRLTPKVKHFLKQKFDDGQLRGVRWQPGTIVNEMKHSKDSTTGNYLFLVSELIKVSTIRSFFSRQKTIRENYSTTDSSTNQDNSLTAADEDDDDANNDNEAFRDQLAMDVEFERADIRSTINSAHTAANESASGTSKRALSSVENETSLHARKSPRLPRKTDNTNILSLSKK